MDGDVGEGGGAGVDVDVDEAGDEGGGVGGGEGVGGGDDVDGGADVGEGVDADGDVDGAVTAKLRFPSCHTFAIRARWSRQSIRPPADSARSLVGTKRRLGQGPTGGLIHREAGAGSRGPPLKGIR